MTANIRKRLISKRGDNSESSDEELVIHLSDTDSVSYYTSSDEEQEPQKESNTKLTRTREISPIPNWADEVAEQYQPERPERQERQKKKEKRISSGKHLEEHPITSRWTHDMYVSDEDTPKKSKPKKATKKAATKVSTPRVKKLHSFADYVKHEPKHEPKHELKKEPSKADLNHMDEDQTLAEPVRQRRGVSQASKNQLIAAFTRNPPLRPTVVPDRKPRSPSPNNEKPPKAYPSPIQQVQTLQSSPQLHKAMSDLALNQKPEKRTKYKKEERTPRSERQEITESVSRSPSHRSTKSTRSNVSKPDEHPLTDQVVQTASGSWAILDSKEKLKPVQPVITPSGHMVLLTESGLMIPATPGMFQHQTWVSQSQQQNPLDPEFYFKQFKNEEGQQALP